MGSKIEGDVGEDSSGNNNIVTYSHRDKGNPMEDCLPMIFEDEDSYLDEINVSYYYLFKNNKWYYKSYDLISFELLEFEENILGSLTPKVNI